MKVTEKYPCIRDEGYRIFVGGGMASCFTPPAAEIARLLEDEFPGLYLASTETVVDFLRSPYIVGVEDLCLYVDVPSMRLTYSNAAYGEPKHRYTRLSLGYDESGNLCLKANGEKKSATPIRRAEWLSARSKDLLEYAVRMHGTGKADVDLIVELQDLLERNPSLA